MDDRQHSAPPSADAASPDERSERHIPAGLYLVAFLGVALLLLLARTLRERGDYLVGAIPAAAFEVRLQPWPRLAMSGPAAGPSGGPRPFLVGGFGRTTYLFHIDSSARAVGVAPASSWSLFGFRLSRGTFSPTPDRPGFVDLTLWAGTTVRLERFPPGTLASAVAAYTSKDFARLLRVAEDLHRRQPDNLTVRFWVVGALLMCGDRDAALERFAAWEADFRADPLGRGPALADSLAADLALADGDYRRRAAWEHVLALKGGRADLARSLAYVRSLATTAPAPPLVFSAHIPDFLAMQVTSKTAVTQALLEAVRGDRVAAHELLVGALRLGGDPRPDRPLIFQLIAIAIRHIVVRAATVVYLEGAQTAETLAAAWPDLAAGWSTRRLPADWMDRLAVINAFDAGGNRIEAETRALVAEATHDLFAAGVRVRHHRLTHGAWPEPAAPGASPLDGLALPLPGDPAAARHLDPFAPGGAPPRTLAFPDRFVIYSLGPDTTNDRATILYDPTNGSVSPGDLVVSVPAVPLYDFPFSPDDASGDADAFDARYPGGLPPDPFLGGTAPLRLARDGSGRVGSVGPDGDRSVSPAMRADPARPFGPMFDPINGTTSEGDLWVELPRRALPAATAAR